MGQLVTQNMLNLVLKSRIIFEQTKDAKVSHSDPMYCLSVWGDYYLGYACDYYSGRSETYE